MYHLEGFSNNLGNGVGVELAARGNVYNRVLVVKYLVGNIRQCRGETRQ